MDAPSEERARERRRDAELVERWRAGDERAFGELYDVWFDRVHDLARRILPRGDLAGEVAQDAFLSAWRRIDTLDDAASFGGWLLRIARNRALNVLEREGRATAVGDEALVAIESQGSPMSAPEGFRFDSATDRWSDPATAVEDVELVAFLWGAVDALGERDRTVLDLSLRHGLTPAEIGEVVGVNRNAANQLVHRVKGRLDKAVSARALWADGAPSCQELAAALSAEGVVSFDDRAVRLVNAHAQRCEECGDRQRSRLAPAAMFGALPMLVAPMALKQEAAAALASAGVPMEGSVHSAAGGGTGGSDGGADGGEGRGSDGGSDSGAGATGPAGTHRRVLVGIGGAVLVILAAVLLWPGGADDGRSDEMALAVEAEPEPVDPPTPDATTPQEASALPAFGHPGGSTTTTTTVVAPAGGPTGPSTTEAPVPPPPPSLPPPPPPPPTSDEPDPPSTPPPTAEVTALSAVLTPQSAPRVFVVGGGEQPVLTWETSGADQVQVLGPGSETLATSLQGSIEVCPGAVVSGVCRSPTGTYQYRVRMFDAEGTLLADQVRSLTIL
jgi:RNA polymerase sigma factor (sigma-70 family)